MTKQLTIQSGLTYVIFAHDAARHINLDAAERRIHEATERQRIKHKKRAPSYFEYQQRRYGSARMWKSRT